MLPVILPAHELKKLFQEIQKLGYEIIGPKLGEGAIIYESIKSPEDLPKGWGDQQFPGRYELYKRQDQAYFGYVVGPHSWKKYLHPSRRKLWSAKRNGVTFEIEPSSLNTKKAFLGVRACEQKAIEILKKTYTQIEPLSTLIIAVNCTQAASTCFCVSMKTGPQIKSGYDLALTEIIKDSAHYFLLESGSTRGKEIITAMSANSPLQTANENHKKAARAEIKKAVKSQKQMPLNSFSPEEARDLLACNLENEYWNEVATRCLSCANCTMSCPTCFCSTVEDVTDLSGNYTERWLKWDSCFTGDFSYVHGGKVRNSTRSRYRQWMTHKLSTWFDQFGTSGCVGCGRCITWCPVGIDLRDGINKIRSSNNGFSEKKKQKEKK